MRRVVLVCALSSVAATVGCSGGSSTPAASPPASITTTSSPTFSVSPTPSPTETPSLSSTVTPSVPASPSATAVAAVECTASQVQVSSGRGGGAAGTFYLSLVFTNTSSSTCSLRGYPGASFVDADGNQLGVPAYRDTTEPVHRVVLASGAKAHALLGTPESVNFSKSDCEPRRAAGVRVYPPDQTESQIAKVTMTVCTTKKGRSLIQPIRPGTRG